MLDKIIVVTDLGPGDGGKGSVIHYLASKEDASIVIKRGGAQGSHGVRTSQGETFNFSQWGCGTLEGISTFCSPQMIISPIGLENEANALKHHGIYDPFSMISVAPDCICSTPYHRIESQLEEIFLEDNPRGTIGTGVGKSYRMYQKFGNGITIKAEDLTDRWILSHKLDMQVSYYRSIYGSSCRDRGKSEDYDLIAKNLDRLYDDGFRDYILDVFLKVGKQLKISRLDTVLKDYSGTAIVECSHGVLTDSTTGFKPHTSAIRTLPKFTNQMLRDAGFTGQILNYGVHRAYEIRHGAGPMPTYDVDFTNKMLPGSHKEENRWQGIVRAGPLDINLLRHALNACSGTHFDGLCLTWFDQITSVCESWDICIGYVGKNEHPSYYTEFLKDVIPFIEHYVLPKSISHEETFSFVDKIVREYVGIPLKMLSIGPTEKDKIMI